MTYLKTYIHALCQQEKTKKITKAKPKPDGKSESKPQGTADDAADDTSTFQIDR